MSTWYRVSDEIKWGEALKVKIIFFSSSQRSIISFGVSRTGSNVSLQGLPQGLRDSGTKRYIYWKDRGRWSAGQTHPPVVSWESEKKNRWESLWKKVRQRPRSKWRSVRIPTQVKPRERQDQGIRSGLQVLRTPPTSGRTATGVI